MQFQFKITIGGTEITVTENAESQIQFVEKLSFFSGLPTVGPNGETDLSFSFRTTKEGHKYYSVVSEKADKEFKLGQSQKNIGDLFGKGWEPIYHPSEGQTEVAGSIGQQQAQPVPQQEVQQEMQQAPIVQQQPVKQSPAVVTPVVQPVSQNTQVAGDVLAKFGVV